MMKMKTSNRDPPRKPKPKERAKRPAEKSQRNLKHRQLKRRQRLGNTILSTQKVPCSVWLSFFLLLRPTVRGWGGPSHLGNQVTSADGTRTQRREQQRALHSPPLP